MPPRLHHDSSPFSSGVIFSIRLFLSSTSSPSQMKAVGGKSSPFPKTNLLSWFQELHYLYITKIHLFSSVHNIESLSATRPMPPVPFGPGWYTRPIWENQALIIRVVHSAYMKKMRPCTHCTLRTFMERSTLVWVNCANTSVSICAFVQKHCTSTIELPPSNAEPALAPNSQSQCGQTLPSRGK